MVLFGTILQPVAAYYSIGRSDSSGYDYDDVIVYSNYFTGESTDGGSGLMDAHGEMDAWRSTYTIMEVGCEFDAPEDGSFKAAADWDITYLLYTYSFAWVLWGKAYIKVEYILFSTGYQRLETKQVYFDQADVNDEVTGAITGKTLSDIYTFSYDLDEGLSYTFVVRLTLYMQYHARIQGLGYNSEAWVDVNSIALWNGPGSPT